MAFSERAASDVSLLSPVHMIQHSSSAWGAGCVSGQPHYDTSLAGRAVNDSRFKLC